VSYSSQPRAKLRRPNLLISNTFLAISPIPLRLMSSASKRLVRRKAAKLLLPLHSRATQDIYRPARPAESPRPRTTALVPSKRKNHNPSLLTEKVLPLLIQTSDWGPNWIRSVSQIQNAATYAIAYRPARFSVRRGQSQIKDQAIVPLRHSSETIKGIGCREFCRCRMTCVARQTDKLNRRGIAIRVRRE